MCIIYTKRRAVNLRRTPRRPLTIPRRRRAGGQLGYRAGVAPTEPDVVSWGEILWDRFPDRRRLGGAPANVAYHLAALGARVALVSRVGDDEPGRAARLALADRGVDVSLIEIDGDRPTGSVEVDTDGDGNATYRLNRGGAWEHIALTDGAAARIGGAAALIYGIFCQRNPAARDAMMGALDAAPDDCLRVCDPNLRATGVDTDILVASIERADVVKINHREADAIERLLGVDDAVDWLLAGRARLVAYTRGADGSRLCTREDQFDHPGFAASGGDTVGAGDAYTAVLVRGLLAGVPLANLVERANRYGAFVASQRGATPEISDALVREMNQR